MTLYGQQLLNYVHAKADSEPRAPGSLPAPGSLRLGLSRLAPPGAPPGTQVNTSQISFTGRVSTTVYNARDVIEYHMRKINNRRNMWWFRGEAKVAGVIVAEAEVGAMLVTE